MSPENVEIVKAIIASIATLGVAGLGLMGVIHSSRKPSKDKPPTGAEQPLAQFNGTQNEFMALVIKDNSDLRAKVLVIEEKIGEIQTHNETFLGAVRRYLMKLATAWGVSGPMPWPDENDFHILEETLPSRPADGAIATRNEI